MSTTQAQTRHITAAWRAASATHRAEGFAWYATARGLAEELALGFVYGNGRLWAGSAQPSESDVRQAAGVIAALSPRLAWRKNVEYARLAYRLRALPQDDFVSALPVMSDPARKAWRILQGESPADVLRGEKVRSFYFTIADPEDPRAVVIDRHAIDVAYGRVLDDATRGKALGRKGAYDEVSTRYRRAAAIITREQGVRWTPAQIQATTWLYWRETHAAAFHG